MYRWVSLDVKPSLHLWECIDLQPRETLHDSVKWNPCRWTCNLLAKEMQEKKKEEYGNYGQSHFLLLHNVGYLGRTIKATELMSLNLVIKMR